MQVSVVHDRNSIELVGIVLDTTANSIYRVHVILNRKSEDIVVLKPLALDCSKSNCLSQAL